MQYESYIYMFILISIIYMLVMSMIMRKIRNIKPNIVVLCILLSITIIYIYYYANMSIRLLINNILFTSILIYVISMLINQLVNIIFQKSKIRITFIVIICTIIANSYISVFNYSTSSNSHQSLEGQVPYLTIQDIESDQNWDETIVFSSVKVHKNIFLSNWIESDELMPFITQDRLSLFYIRSIHTEYYAFKLTSWSCRMLSELLERDKPSSGYTNYKSDILGDIYYYKTEIANETVYFIYYCIDNKTIHMQFFCKDETDLSKIITALERG